MMRGMPSQRATTQICPLGNALTICGLVVFADPPSGPAREMKANNIVLLEQSWFVANIVSYINNKIRRMKLLLRMPPGSPATARTASRDLVNSHSTQCSKAKAASCTSIYHKLMSRDNQCTQSLCRWLGFRSEGSDVGPREPRETSHSPSAQL